MFDPDGFNPPPSGPSSGPATSSKQPAEARQVREKRWEFLAERPRSFTRERLPVRPRLGPQPAQRVRLPRRHLQPAEDGDASSPWSSATASRATRTSPASSPRACSSSRPDEVDYAYRLDGRKTLCNVGSVGQPRDGDPRACYVLLDGDTIRYRRVEYDIETTIKKIYAIPDLENFLGDRLREGR